MKTFLHAFALQSLENLIVELDVIEPARVPEKLADLRVVIAAVGADVMAPFRAFFRDEPVVIALDSREDLIGKEKDRKGARGRCRLDRAHRAEVADSGHVGGKAVKRALAVLGRALPEPLEACTQERKEPIGQPESAGKGAGEREIREVGPPMGGADGR